MPNIKPSETHLNFLFLDVSSIFILTFPSIKLNRCGAFQPTSLLFAIFSIHYGHFNIDTKNTDGNSYKKKRLQ